MAPGLAQYVQPSTGHNVAHLGWASTAKQNQPQTPETRTQNSAEPSYGWEQQLTLQRSPPHSLTACPATRTHLLKGPHGVYFGFDFALAVQANQLGYNTTNELKLFIHVTQVVASHGLVEVQELQSVDAELVPPRFSHGHQVLLLPGEQVCHP